MITQALREQPHLPLARLCSTLGVSRSWFYERQAQTEAEQSLADAESFKTLQREEVYLKEFHTFAEAEANIGQFIEDLSSQERLHSSLGYLSPAESEALHCQTAEIVT